MAVVLQSTAGQRLTEVIKQREMERERKSEREIDRLRERLFFSNLSSFFSFLSMSDHVPSVLRRAGSLV